MTVAFVAFFALLAACSDNPPDPAADSKRASPPAKTAVARSAKSSDLPPWTSTTPAKDLMVGTWSYVSVELKGLPEPAKSKAENEAKQFDLEFTSDAILTKKGGETVSTQSYKITEEGPRTVTYSFPDGKTETVTFEDEDTMRVDNPGLGKIVLKRQGS